MARSVPAVVAVSAAAEHARGYEGETDEKLAHRRSSVMNDRNRHHRRRHIPGDSRRAGAGLPYRPYDPLVESAAWAATSRAIGTRKGEQLT